MHVLHACMHCQIVLCHVVHSFSVFQVIIVDRINCFCLLYKQLGLYMQLLLMTVHKVGHISALHVIMESTVCLADYRVS